MKIRAILPAVILTVPVLVGAASVVRGALDSHFGAGGVVVTDTAPSTADDEIFAMALQGGAHLIAAGECDQPATGRNVCVARYNLDGGPAR